MFWTIIQQIIGIFTGPLRNTLVKIFGMIAFRLLGFWLERAAKKKAQEEYNAGLQTNIDAISQNGADAVSNLEKSMHLNDEMLKTQETVQREKLRQEFAPEIHVPPTIKVGQQFVVETRNIPAGLVIFADKKWALGSTNEDGHTVVLLNSAGKRTLDIEVSAGQWFSIIIEVV